VKRVWIIFILTLILWISGIADVTKKTAAKTSFMGLGTLIVTSDTYLKGNKQLVISDQNFQAKGFLGKMLSRLFKGEKGTLIDLEQKKIFDINYARESYTSMNFADMASKLKGMEEAVEEKTEEEPEEDNIIVIKNELRVDHLDKSRTIAGYPCKGVKITWDYEYKEKDSDKHAAMQAVIYLWTASEDAKLSQLKKEELEFGKKYAAALGIDKDFFSEDILGLKWFDILSKMNQKKDNRAPALSDEDLQRIKNIKGYPLASEGVFKVKDMSPNKEKMEEDEGIDLSKGLGGLFGKKLKKKKEKTDSGGFQSLFEFSMEVKSFSTNPVSDDQVQIPAGFQQK
jgi:hypothetical protein